MRHVVISVLILGVLTLFVWGCSDTGCPEGYIDCAGNCTELAGDPDNCGGCGQACGQGHVCTAGACELTCPDGMTVCDGVCRDLMTDFYNCGTCALTCAAGYVCTDGGCTPECPDGYTACSGYCKNLQNDPSNCGECGSACAAGEVCMAGVCEFTCPTPYIDCSGSCVDLDTDHMNCGACGSACLSGQICSEGACTNSCVAGLTLCSGACADLQRDPQNCGSCATRCASDQACVGGTCILACTPGFVDCSGSCRDLQTDRMNCGSCATECAIAEVCNAGVCTFMCLSPLTDCSGICTNLADDPDNCGTCGTVCDETHATAYCASGACGLVCDTDWDDCDVDVTTGCEAPLAYDLANCGTCGTTCGTDELCISGSCEPITGGGPRNILFVSDVTTDTNIPDALRVDGHTVVVVTGDYASGNAALLGSLSAYHMVYWSATGPGFGDVHSPTVIAALETWVTSGRCVFVTGYDSIASPMDTALIGFVGGTGSRDVPGAVGPVSSAPNSLNYGITDIRGVTPTGGYSDRDALTGLTGVTVAAYSSGSTTEAQWTVRTLGAGQIAYVSNGSSSTTTPIVSWTTTTSGGAGAYNAALRNFAFNCP
ncbi:MAG: hypothetical protein JRG91_08895 [Deltaproteobacteria bacterium]|nr:hypothetical protein [Deltaproteobacteria bacterium]